MKHRKIAIAPEAYRELMRDVGKQKSDGFRCSLKQRASEIIINYYSTRRKEP